MSEAGQKLLKKLTIRDMIGGRANILAAAMTGRPVGKDAAGKEIYVGNDGADVPLLRVLGQLSGFKAGETDNGSYVELRGIFQGTNLMTGEIVDNVPRAILPNVIGEPLAEAMKDGAEGVEFAVEISVAYSETAVTMYTFSARSLMPTKPAAPLLGIMAQLEASGVKMSKPLALAAPKLSDEDKAKQAAAVKAADEKKAADKIAAGAGKPAKGAAK